MVDTEKKDSEKTPIKKTTMGVVLLLLIVSVIGICSTIWLVLYKGQGDGVVPVITEGSAIKKTPQFPSGMKVEHMDKEVYNEAIGGYEKDKIVVERLLPEPERPIIIQKSTKSKDSTIPKDIEVAPQKSHSNTGTKGVAGGQGLKPAYKKKKLQKQWMVQLTLARPKDATKVFKQMQKRHTILSNYTLRTGSVFLKGKEYATIMIGPFDTLRASRKLCVQLKKQKGDCFIKNK